MTRTTRPATYTTKNIWESCGKCEGTGSVSWGIDVDGAVHLVNSSGETVGRRTVSKVCFTCNGVGGKRVSQAQLDRRVADRKRREAKREAKIKDAVTAREAFAAGEPEVFAWMEAEATSFAASLQESFFRNTLNGRPALTEKQLAAAKKSIAKDAERAAKRQAERDAASPVVEGRETVTGEVVTIKALENNFSYSGGITLKMLVKDDRGFKVWGTVPRSIEVERGDRVTFTATLSASTDDETFGFFKRPTKADVMQG